MSNKNFISVRVDSSVGCRPENIADILLYLQQVDVFNNGSVGFRCELNTAPVSRIFRLDYLLSMKAEEVEYKAWVEHPESHYNEELYFGYDRSMYTPLVFKITVKHDYLLLSGVEAEQLSAIDFLDKKNLPYITRNVMAERCALRLHSFVFSANNSIKYAFDILTDSIYLPKCEAESNWVNTEYIATRLKSLIGDVDRMNFARTGSYNEDINSHIDFINQTLEFMQQPSDFNFCYTISLKRDAQVQI